MSTLADGMADDDALTAWARPTDGNPGAACRPPKDAPTELLQWLAAIFHPVAADDLKTGEYDKLPHADRIAAAIGFCTQCPVAAECLRYAVTERPGHLGIYGGMGHDKRRALRRIFLEDGADALDAAIADYLEWLDDPASFAVAERDMFDESTRPAALTSRQNPQTVTHGTRSAANRGCLCDACRLTVSMYSRSRRLNEGRRDRSQSPAPAATAL